jgi:hypothetical protein
MLPDFKNIEYLSKGSNIQQQGWRILKDIGILSKLKDFNAVLAGTLPLDLYIDGKSDLDIICNAADLTQFQNVIIEEFSAYDDFTMERKSIRQTQSVIVRFQRRHFLFEIFAQQTPVENQYAYRHLRVEYYLLQRYGTELKERVFHFKQSGLKTEPAFAVALQLAGDPYEALLEFEKLIAPD